jgi:Ca2+-binding RTX toxin-like protein
MFLGGIVATAVFLALPAAASAAVTCSFDTGTGALSVTVTSGTTQAVLSHDTSPSTDILIDNDTNTGNGTVSCTNGPPTDATTNSIAVDENGSNQSTALTVNFARGRLAPGAGVDVGTPEIEISYLTDTTGSDSFNVIGSTESADQTFQFGAIAPTVISGNLNGDADADDVTLTGVERLSVTPGTGNDTFTGDGTGSGSFTGPVPAVMRADGSQGNETFATGTGSNNILTGGPGNDSLIGGSNTDTLDMAEGNDTMDGGGGIDFASYESDPSATGVTLDLSQAGPQNTGDLGIDQVTNTENAVGSNGGDHLTGTNGPNTLFGGNFTNDTGNDVLVGGGGSDDLIGWKGNDVLIGGQGDDLLEGDAGNDTANFASGSTGPVTFSLNQALTGIAQATGGAGSDTLDDGVPTGDSNHEIENLIGSPFGGDVLTGNAAPNQIDVRDGLGDSADCVGPANGNLAVTDQPGVDSVANCESIDALPAPPGPSVPADQIPPDTTVSGKAKVRTRKKRALVSWILGTTEPGSSFECSLDGGTFFPCTSPFSVRLRRGAHTLTVRSRDAAGNLDPSPASFTTRVRRIPPS